MQIRMAVLALLLGGCVITPKEVLDQEARFTGPIDGTPMAAASCVARNAEHTGIYLATTLQMRTGDVEVIVRSSVNTLHTVSVWHFSAKGQTSVYAVKISPNLKNFGERLFKTIKGDC